MPTDAGHVIAGLPGLAELRVALNDDGIAVVGSVVPAPTIERLRSVITDLGDREEVRRKGGIFGVRNLLEICPEARDLAVSAELRSVVEPVLGPEAFAVRATLFDKIPTANWKLGWHQDSTITVLQRLDVDGFGPWSEKVGVWHVEPPAEVMGAMLAVRVHLDDCGPDNGPLRVLPGSHRYGWIDDLTAWKRDVEPVVCVVRAGGVILMNPLLLHASSAAVEPTHRRVIHIEYANEPLPGGMEWHTRLSP